MRIIAALTLASGLIAAAAADAAAREPTGEQANVIRHIAEATVISRMCPRYTIDEAMIGAALAMTGMSAAVFEPGGDFANRAASEIAKAAQVAHGRDTETVCAIGKIMYGPGGAEVPGFLIEQ